MIFNIVSSFFPFGCAAHAAKKMEHDVKQYKPLKFSISKKKNLVNIGLNEYFESKNKQKKNEMRTLQNLQEILI